MLVAIGVSPHLMMSVGTPPSAIACSTRVVRVRDMIRNGFRVILGTGMLLVAFSYLFHF